MPHKTLPVVQWGSSSELHRGCHVNSGSALHICALHTVHHALAMQASAVPATVRIPKWNLIFVENGTLRADAFPARLTVSGSIRAWVRWAVSQQIIENN